MSQNLSLYHLFVSNTGSPEGLDSITLEIPLNKIFNFTEKKIKASFQPLSGAIKELKEYPVLLSYEDSMKQDARVAWITNIVLNINSAIVEFEFDVEWTPISSDMMEFFENELGMEAPSERSQVHWSPKEINLFSILKKMGIKKTGLIRSERVSKPDIKKAPAKPLEPAEEDDAIEIEEPIEFEDPIENEEVSDAVTTAEAPRIMKSPLAEEIAPAQEEFEDNEFYEELDEEPIGFKEKTDPTLVRIISNGSQGELDDLIGIDREVATFARLAASKSSEPPTSIAVLGGRGAGKTFFMRKMKKAVAESAEAKSRVFQIDFNASHYQDTNLWTSLPKYIFTALEHEHKKENRSDKTRDAFFLQIKKAQQPAKIADLRRNFAKLSTLMSKKQADKKNPKIDRVVLYIDDIDCCPAEMGIDLLQIIQNLFSFRLFAVVLSVDPQWLSDALQQKILADENIDSNDRVLKYLEKVFQISYWVHPLDDKGAFRFVKGLIEKEVKQGASGALTTFELRLMQRLSPIYALTPRKAIGYLNSYRLIRASMIRESVEDFIGGKGEKPGYRTLLILLAIQTGHPRLGTEFLQKLNNLSSKEGFWDLFAQLEQTATPKEWNLIKTILEALTPVRNSPEFIAQCIQQAAIVRRFSFSNNQQYKAALL